MRSMMSYRRAILVDEIDRAKSPQTGTFLTVRAMRSMFAAVPRNGVEDPLRNRPEVSVGVASRGLRRSEGRPVVAGKDAP